MSRMVESTMSADLAADRRESDATLVQGQLDRNFSVWSLGGLCLCSVGTWEALSSFVALALISGGAPCLFFNYIVTFIGTIAVITSLAEIASMYPNAGGQYFWVAKLAPPEQRLAASWFAGWVSIGGLILGGAAAGFAGGLQLQGLIALNEGTYVPKAWHGMLLYDLVLVYALLVNVYGIKILPRINTVSGIFHILGFLVLLIVLCVLAPKHTARFVFLETTNLTGWPNDGIAWLIGLLSTTSTQLGYDTASHLSEELPNPKRNVPIAMVSAMLINGIVGLIWCIVLLFCLGDPEEALNSPTGFPFMHVFYNATGNAASASAMSLVVTLIALAANAGGLTSSSRTFWAFARDNATPQAGYFAHIDAKLHIPTRMIVLISILEFLLGFLYLGNSTAFSAVLSMAVLAICLSYFLPIFYMLSYGRKPGAHEPGPFKLGWVGPFVNVFALCWIVLAMFFSTWPNFYPVTAENMNYSTVVLAAWIGVGGTWYAVRGRKKYSGPVAGSDENILAVSKA